VALSDQSKPRARTCRRQHQVRTMAKQRTELERRCPSPPYTRWDQRKKPVLLCHMKNIDGKSLCLSLQTQNPDIAKKHMRLIVGCLLAKRRLSPDGGAAKAYGPKGTGLAQFKKLDTEIRRLQALPDAKYGPAAVSIAKRRECPVGIIHSLAGRKPELAPGTYATRRMRARSSGRAMPMGVTWEHRRQGERYFYWNRKVLTARFQIDRRNWSWPLKVTDEQEAEAIMAPVRDARKRLYRAAAEGLNYELGTDAAVAAATERAAARAELASAILTAGGPKALVELVLKGPQEGAGTNIPQRAAVVTAVPTGKTLRQIARKGCLEKLIGLLRCHDLPPEGTLPRQCEAAMQEFAGLSERAFYVCLREAERITGNYNWSKGGRRQE
jgi:hypothetical protein